MHALSESSRVWGRRELGLNLPEYIRRIDPSRCSLIQSLLNLLNRNEIVKCSLYNSKKNIVLSLISYSLFYGYIPIEAFDECIYNSTSSSGYYEYLGSLIIPKT